MDVNCTVYKTVDFIGKRWTLLILLELFKSENSVRYSELKRRLPRITPKMLAARLKELEAQGLLSKTVDNTQIPISCTYALTESGIDFIPIIQNIKTWSLKWKFKNKECQELDCRDCTF